MERSDNPTLEEKVYSEYIIFCSSNKSFNSSTIYRKTKATVINNCVMLIIYSYSRMIHTKVKMLSS